jgi:hypothetical protein
MNKPSELAGQLEIAHAIVNASASIDVLAPAADQWVLPIEQDIIRLGSSRRLRMRYLVRASSAPTTREERFLRSLVSAGWEVMWINSPSTLLGIIIDGSTAYISPPAGGARAFKVVEERLVEVLARHFDRVWTTAQDHPGLDVLYDPILAEPTLEVAQAVQVASRQQWDRIISELARHGEDIYSLDPRRFEELIAELLQRDRPNGRIIELTPKAKDDGRDILVYDHSEVGQHLFLVECKRYAPDNPVDVGIVRQLFGVIEGERASAGVLVTTSHFTEPARRWPVDRDLQYRLSLRDYDNLTAWIAKHVH